MNLSSLGCLDGVDLLAFSSRLDFHMGGHVAVAVFPSQGRVWCSNAIRSGFKLRDSLASLTFVDNGQTIAFIIAATLGCHKYAIITFSYGSTNHNNILLFKI